MGTGSSSIIVCGQRFDVGQRVITWQDDPGINAYTPSCIGIPGRIYPTQPAQGMGLVTTRYRERRHLGTERTLARLSQVVRQFVVHLDGMPSSRETFKVLHDERGLSAHFLIDNNGDIYQTLDLADCAFHAAGVNEISIGVEIANRGDASKGHDIYQGKRDKVTCTVNGYQILCYVFTEEQFQAMVNIGRCLARILPGLALDFPRIDSGDQVWATLAADPRSFSGYLGHYHTTNRKWDPGPFDFKKLIARIRGRIFYPALPSEGSTSELPAEPEAAQALTQALYDNNEKDGDGGYFPVGPLGESKLWHGGVHLRADRGRPVVAPFSGRIVAARQKPEDDWPAIGSNNMLLLRHDLNVGNAALRFFTLFHHLDAESADAAEAPGWFKASRQKPWAEALAAGEIALVDEPVSAGEVIGHFGEAGPRGARSGQIHFAVFSEEELGQKIDPSYWALVDSSQSGRFCADDRITAYMDLNRDGVLQRRELATFFRDPSQSSRQAREVFRRLAVRHLSEWGDRGGDFARELWRSREFRALVPPARMRQVYDDQIASMFWWTEEVGEHAGLPGDLLVWSYHPITFVRWLHDHLKSDTQGSQAIQSADAYRGEGPPPELHGGDISEEQSGEFFIDDEDALFGEAAKKLTLEQLAEGYPD